MNTEITPGQMASRAEGFEWHLQKKYEAMGYERFSQAKRFWEMVLQREELKTSSEEEVRLRLMTAYDQLVEKRLEQAKKFHQAIPGDLSFQDSDIIVMDAQLRYASDDENFHFMPRQLSRKGFDQLVDESMLVRTTRELNGYGDRKITIDHYTRPGLQSPAESFNS